jgi:hypothetical protein
MGAVTRAEWRWAAAFSAAAAAVLLLPYVIAYSAQGDAWRFSGFLFGVEDGNSYIADMRQGAGGAWLFRIPYTTEPQHGTLMYLPYLLLGKLAAGPARHEQLVVLFHLAQFAAAMAMLLAIYRFLAVFVENVGLRRWGWFAAAFGGGFGWLLLTRPASYPLEFTSPEAFGFLALFGIPHLAAARAFLLLALAWFAAEPQPGARLHPGVKVGLALALGWLFQPLIAAVAPAVMVAYVAAVFLRGRFRRTDSQLLRGPLSRALIATAIVSPLLLYTALSIFLDPVLRRWAAQNLLPAPPFSEYLLSFAVLLLPAAAGAVRSVRAGGRYLLPAAWLAIFPALVYAPVSIQRRLAEGVWTALVALALVWIEPMPAGRLRRGFFVLASALLLPAAALFYGLTAAGAVSPAAPAFVPAEEVRALEWVDAKVEAGAVVLAPYAAGNALPAYADVYSYIGHGPETADLAEKLVLARTVFDGSLPAAERLAALRQTGADYVFLGPEEAASFGFGLPGSRLIYSAGGWQVWKVDIRTDPVL